MSVGDRLQTVRARIGEVAERSGRDLASIKLVGISKGAPAIVVAEAIAAGLHDIGENRVQEAAPKIPEAERLAGAEPQWHLVGHLQSNKARPALELFDTIQSVDSLRIAQALSRLATRPLPIMLEVQFARTPDRYGFDPDAVDEAFTSVAALPNLQLIGLMTVAPLGLTPEATRAVFRTLRDCAARIEAQRPGMAALELSMGMSEDYEIAIEEGATIVRIGRAIFAG